MPSRWAVSATAWNVSSGQTLPPPRLCVFSRQRSVAGAEWKPPWGCTASSTCSGVKTPRSPSIKAVMTPARRPGPPASEVYGCAQRSSTILSPGLVWTLIPIALHIVPDGRKRAASFPVSSATISCRRLTVGSSRSCSSPTGASAMARRISGDGRVAVSLIRSIMIFRYPPLGSASSSFGPDYGGSPWRAPHPHTRSTVVPRRARGYTKPTPRVSGGCRPSSTTSQGAASGEAESRTRAGQHANLSRHDLQRGAPGDLPDPLADLHRLARRQPAADRPRHRPPRALPPRVARPERDGRRPRPAPHPDRERPAGGGLRHVPARPGTVVVAPDCRGVHHVCRRDRISSAVQHDRRGGG